MEPGGFISWQGGNTEALEAMVRLKASDGCLASRRKCTTDQNQGPGTASLFASRVGISEDSDTPGSGPGGFALSFTGSHI